MDEIYDFFGVVKEQFLESKKNNISKKLILVAQECGKMNINLSGKYKNDIKKIYFDYLTIEDLQALLNPILTKNNLFIKVYPKILDSSSPAADKVPFTMHLIVYVFIRDADSGEAEIFAEHGFGVEYGKPAYTKAVNSALRMLWRNNLCLRYGAENKQNTSSNSSLQKQKNISKNNSQTKSSATPQNKSSSTKNNNQAATSASVAVNANTGTVTEDKVLKIDDKIMNQLNTKYKYFSKITDEEFEKEYLAPRGLSLKNMCELTMSQGRDIINELKKGTAISA